MLFRSPHSRQLLKILVPHFMIHATYYPPQFRFPLSCSRSNCFRSSGLMYVSFMVSTSVTQNTFAHRITSYVFMGETVMSRAGGTFKLLPRPPPAPYSSAVIKSNPGTPTLDLQTEVACDQQLPVPRGTPLSLYGKFLGPGTLSMSVSNLSPRALYVLMKSRGVTLSMPVLELWRPPQLALSLPSTSSTRLREATTNAVR